MKAFFSKIWTWILANKVIAIVAASVVVVGAALAITLPIALHEHSYADEWSSDAENHWHDATCKHEEEKSDSAAHTYANACDATCDVCGYTRTVGAHVYDNACDASCNACGVTRTPAAHVYDNACDESCNVCGAVRTVTHDHAATLTKGDTTHYYLCSVCGDKKGEAAHVFDKTVATAEYLKDAATATTKAQYYKSCVCGKASATEYFETDKIAGTLANIQDLSKTYDKVELANPTYETNSDGAVTVEWYQGDTKLDAKPVNAGTYKVKVIIAESATYAGISAEKEFTIAKKVISNLEAEFVYNNYHAFHSEPLGAVNGIVSNDLPCGIFVTVEFNGVNVGSTVNRAYLNVGSDTDVIDNYTLDLTTCSASIVPKVLTNISLGNTIYKGSTNFAFALSASHGLVSGETFTLQVTTASKNVGNAVEIVSISYNNSNYSIDKSAITLHIVPKTLNYLELTKVYDGKAGYNDSVFFLDTTHGLVAGDVVSIETNDDAEYNVGTYTLTDTSGRWELDDGIYLEGADAANYAFNYQANGAVATITVTPKPLNLLDIEFTYDGGNIPASFDLTAADGVIAGDDVWLYGDGWQGYDVAYDEYTLTDDLGDYDYDEGVELRGADKGNYKFTYDTDGSVGKITVMPYILDFNTGGEYVKDADGTHYFSFTQDVTWSQGSDTVTVKIALIDSEGNWITAPGVYTQENAEICDETFYVKGVECEGFELDEDYYADEFKITVLSTDDLILQTTDRFHIDTDYIISVKVKQGTVKVGDSIVLPGTPDKVYEVLNIEKFHKFVEYATVGDEVGLYVDGMAELTEVPVPAFLYENGNIPEMASEFLAKLYLKTQAEGGRQNPVTGTYTPTLRGLGTPQQATLTLISHYAKEDTLMWFPGETVLAKITLPTPVPAALLPGLEFTMAQENQVTVTGVVVDDIINSAQSGNTMHQTDTFNTEALTPAVVKITNTRAEAFDYLEVFVSNGSGGGSYLTDFTLELYDKNFVRILGTHNNTEGTFTKDDSSKWSLSAGATCYVVIKTTNAASDVFVRLM